MAASGIGRVRRFVAVRWRGWRAANGAGHRRPTGEIPRTLRVTVGIRIGVERLFVVPLVRVTGAGPSMKDLTSTLAFVVDPGLAGAVVTGVCGVAAALLTTRAGVRSKEEPPVEQARSRRVAFFGGAVAVIL